MSGSEEASFELVRDAISENIQCVGVELMLADSSRAHFSPVFSMPDGFTGCGVGSPRACPATSGTQVQRFPRSDALAACPHLRRGRDRPCSAVCIPLAIAGKSVGVLHAVDVVGEEADSDFVETLMLVSRKAGERLSALRALARTETQARTDALTGLLNRRSLEDEVKALVDDGRHFVVAFADLDHFKQLNDVHGHDTGDRALRLFGQVLSDGVRPADLVARYGGEEFVLVLPDCSVSDAINVVERLRTRLTTQLTDGRLPGFTVSVGIASSSGRASFGTTLDAADAALLKAKAQGRDRIVVDGTAIEIEPPSASQHAGPQIAA
jgi:diguanylate cyclase (GGDEF)-like protein